MSKEITDLIENMLKEKLKMPTNEASSRQMLKRRYDELQRKVAELAKSKPKSKEYYSAKAELDKLEAQLR